MKKLISNNLYAIKQIWKYEPTFVVVEIISCFSGIFEPLVQVYFLKNLIEFIIDGEQLSRIIGLVLLFTFCKGFLMCFFNIMNESYFPKKSEIIKNKLTLEYMQKLKQLDVECFDNREYYDAYTRSVGEATERPMQVFITLIRFLVCIFEIGTLITLMLTMDSVAIILAVLNVLLAMVWQTKKGSVSYQMNMEKTFSERLKTYFFSLFWGNDYAKEIRTSSLSELAEKKYEENAKNSLGISGRYLKKISVINTKTALSNALSFGFMYGYFAVMAYNGRISVGSIAALLVAVSQLTQSIAQLFQYLPEFYQHSLYIENLFPILNYEPRIERNDGISIESIDSIEFQNVSFTYPFTDSRVLDNVSFKVARGEKIALVGHNGAGKTTLFKLLCRFYDVEEGRILVNGIDIREYNVHQLRKLYGIVFQDYKLFHTSIAENLLCQEYEEGDRAKLLHVLDECMMGERVAKIEQGLLAAVSKEFDENGEIFSGGEQQKLVVARAMLQNPDVLLMDEPSSALDPMAEMQLIKLMNQVAQDKLGILITHRLSNVCNADKIVLLNHGIVKETGTHQELMKLRGAYCEMFEAQSEQYVA